MSGVSCENTCLLSAVRIYACYQLWEICLLSAVRIRVCCQLREYSICLLWVVIIHVCCQLWEHKSTTVRCVNACLLPAVCMHVCWQLWGYMFCCQLRDYKADVSYENIYLLSAARIHNLLPAVRILAVYLWISLLFIVVRSYPGVKTSSVQM